MLDDVRVSVLHPSLPDWERQDVRNADSIVIEMRWGEVSFVFTGDIDRETEAAIAPLLQPAPLRVLKVPHHGSSTSSSEAFVRAVRPDVAVISVGRSNNFGHPSPLVLKRYEQAGSRLFRTDQDGAITIDTDGTSLEISTFTGSTVRRKITASRRLNDGVETLASALFLGLARLPFRFEVIDAHVRHPRAPIQDSCFHVREAPRELVVGLAQRGFRLDAQPPRGQRSRTTGRPFPLSARS